MSIEQTRIYDGVICAYDEHVLVRPYERTGDIIVVEFNPEVFKGTVLSVGEDVPGPINAGDLIWYVRACKLEPDIFGVHFSDIMAFSRFVDE